MNQSKTDLGIVNESQLLRFGINHATWECKYHVVFAPKYRKKLLFGKIKRHLGQVCFTIWRDGRSAGSRKDI